MKTEMKSLNDNDVWELVELPSGRKKVGSKWVYTMKTGADGNVERYKPRLVAQGYTQKFGTDYDKTFCPVARQESLRVLLALSVQYGLKLHQVDVTTEFLNGTLEEEVYMAQPEGYVSLGQETLCASFRRASTACSNHLDVGMLISRKLASHNRIAIPVYTTKAPEENWCTWVCMWTTLSLLRRRTSN